MGFSIGIHDVRGFISNVGISSIRESAGYSSSTVQGLDLKAIFKTQTSGYCKLSWNWQLHVTLLCTDRRTHVQHWKCTTCNPPQHQYEKQ